MEKNREHPPRGKWLYKKYVKQYQSWWGNGIEKAEHALHKDKEDIVLFTFDISDYYHSIRFSLDEIKCDIESSGFSDDITDDEIWKRFSEIYQKYWELVKASGLTLFANGMTGSAGPIPISLYSSPIIANWYLKEFDEYIRQEYNCLYYGRYVDDILFVMRKAPRSNVSDIESALKVYFPNVVKYIKGSKPLDASFCENISSNKLEENQNDRLQNHLKSLRLQGQKIFCYEFDKSTPSLLLEKFVEEQRQRSSEYRFLSDEKDVHFSSFDNLQLDSCFDSDDSTKSRFKNLEDNRFQISVFLAKLSKRIVEKGPSYKAKEVEKVYQYFQGIRVIEYYQFWEKILTLFVLTNRSDYVEKFVQVILSQIKNIKKIDNVDQEEEMHHLEVLKVTLIEHLVECLKMSLSYHLCAFGSFIDNFVNCFNKSIKNHLESLSLSDFKLYINSFMSRTQYNVWPLQQFMKGYGDKGVFMDFSDLEKLDLSEKGLKNYQWVPYYVKFYELVLSMAFTSEENKGIDYVSAEKAYRKINKFPIPKELKFVREGDADGFNWKNYEVNAYDIEKQFNDKIVKNGQKSHDIRNHVTSKDEITVAIAEIDVSKKILDEAIDNKTNTPQRTERMKLVLDKVSEIPDVDVLVLPELSLQVRSLAGFCQMSAKKQVAFIAGLEYYIRGENVYNQIVTCIPINLGYFVDAIPFIRNKNHFAPVEIEGCEHRHLKYIEGNPKTYALFHFRGHVFTSYYCFELANVRARSLFYSKIDAMYAPVFNRDTYYYNNIIGSTVRDMHCYFVQANVAEYGWSQICQPTKHDYMQPLFVKGGISSPDQVLLLSGKLRIKALREHQKLSLFGQLNNKDVFKPTPPDYDRDWLKERIKDDNLIGQQEAIQSAIDDL